MDVHLYWREGCPHCDTQKAALARIGARQPRLRVLAHEVVHDAAGRAHFLAMAEQAGFAPRAVPVVVICGEAFVGSRETSEAELEDAVTRCLQERASGTDAGGDRHGSGPAQAGAQDRAARMRVPGLGDVDLGGQSLWLATALIAFVDGFNPCSLWVLSILLAMVLRAGSRRRIVLIGVTFLVVTAAVYGLFIAGLFSVLRWAAWLEGVRIGVALAALLFALVNIKDYFFYKQGLSFTIDDKHKPGLYQRIRTIINGPKAGVATVLATASMALGISLVELPCTAGFPVLWSNLVAAQQVSGAGFAALLGLYLLIYLLDELVIFATVVVTLRMTRMQERHGRVLKLVGGGVMLALALALLLRPRLLDDLPGALIVFGAAAAGVALVLLVHRVLLPRLGIRFGSEDLGGPPPPP